MKRNKNKPSDVGIVFQKYKYVTRFVFRKMIIYHGEKNRLVKMQSDHKQGQVPFSL